jgi:hypothetical protein
MRQREPATVSVAVVLAISLGCGGAEQPGQDTASSPPAATETAASQPAAAPTPRFVAEEEFPGLAAPWTGDLVAA